uniref:Rad51-like C-terminal domain-containing protein n=1 Tax=Strombidium rassoulzadegani TaxID=1082188 RepID=A0A7S3FW46_9SPIT|mmetsp:Transcript_13391/g.22803  ORF Transcript_13391/g.22803 Transcript_13391/m.22803 type:complete len:207 (+) Transcript_13391:327-947(+)
MTGKPLNEKRFNDLKDGFLGRNKNKITEQQIKENIIFSYCQTLEDYNKVFINLSQRIENEKIKLVIIDNIQSIGDNFIKTDGNVDFIERSNFLLKHSKNLKKLAYQFGLIIIILNNATSDINGNNGDPSRGFFQEKRNNVQPALGLLWSNCVNERICLKKKSMGGNHSNIDGQNVRRTICIEKSSFLKRYETEFELTMTGVKGKNV